MGRFPIHTTESAPEGSKETLQQAEKHYGMLPNVLGVLAEAPSALKGYAALSQLLEQSSFGPLERQVIFLTISFENQCHYCVAAHSAVAKMRKVPESVVRALREGRLLADSKLEALRRFVSQVVAQRGNVSNEELENFRQAGHSSAQVLEVITAVAMKTISNYTNHIAKTPLDKAFWGEKWTSPAATVA